MRLDYDTRGIENDAPPLPKVWNVRQKANVPELKDVEGAVKRAAERLLEDERLKPGASVAVGVGSRGVDNIQLAVRTVVCLLKERGCAPFIVPAMGSHGGATAEGQAAVLAEYGITAEKVGAPVRATMEVKKVAELDDGYPVYFDCNALGADAVVVINRIKPHTDFRGEIESGLAKICAIGLGKQKGAASIHRFGAEGLKNIMPAVARKLCETVNIVGGVALIEDLHGKTAEVHGLMADEIGRRPEKQLLQRARALSPKMPLEMIDVMVIDLMGKEISGSGMDTHVIGRARMPSLPESEWDGPDVRLVCVLDITAASHGNAAGLGLADLTTKKLIEKVDFAATNTNHRTSGEGGILRGRLPLVLDDAEACVKTAIGGCGRGKWEEVRLVRIRSTEHIEEFQVSEALLDEVRRREVLEVIDGPHRLNLSEPLEVRHKGAGE